MRRLIFLPVTAALAACGSQVGQPAQPESDAAEFYSMGPGVYDIEGGPGVVYATSELREDGTYVDSSDEGEVGRGRWTADGARVCFDPEGDGENEQERCWTNSPLQEDGRFVTTRDDGSESYTVRPRAAD